MCKLQKGLSSFRKKDSGCSLSFIAEKASWDGPVATSNETVSLTPIEFDRSRYMLSCIRWIEENDSIYMQGTWVVTRVSPCLLH
ncbi:hypothetical protein NC653_022751 [Populus alba x Populus x berolinensis]|uniref:Uncharacterized protein n=1 Tax=Populus alba x Populus x berolinensis TaxID=444605 RepID=A0AAD6MFH1_9ROSI|nr:hypothetical protein NC653_022751 [Populus alba x Populus x berolinensis]